MTDIEGFILAGGESRRMGRDKANLLLGDETLVEHVASSLLAVTNRIFIVGDLTEHAHRLPLVRDEFKSRNGPQKRGSIIGMHAALVHSATTWSVILACDMPFVSTALLERILSFEREDLDAVVPLQSDGKPQPLCALYRGEVCLPVIEALLLNNEWSLQSLLRKVRTRFIEFKDISDLPHADYFFSNINTPDDYAAALAVLGAD